MIDLVDFASMKLKFNENMMRIYLLIKTILGIFMQKISWENQRSFIQAFSILQLEMPEIKVPEKTTLLEIMSDFKEQLPVPETNFELSAFSFILPSEQFSREVVLITAHFH
ncbi:MAG: hypothetical protein AAGE84_16020 [Cyanobacteria bacterium P01_G01_bin.39]